MHGNIYVRLVVLTIGTLLPFFWIVVILGHRRQRNFERIFFFFCLSLVFFFAGSLLALNAQLFYPVVPGPLERFAWALVCGGLWFLPALLVHLHIEYAQVRELLRPGTTGRLWLVAAYAPGVALLPSFIRALGLRQGLDFSFPSSVLGRGFQLWLVLGFAVASFWQHKFANSRHGNLVGKLLIRTVSSMVRRADPRKIPVKLPSTREFCRRRRGLGRGLLPRRSGALRLGARYRCGSRAWPHRRQFSTIS